MKALCWYGKGDVRIETVDDPTIINNSDIILEVTSTAICGSDLHLYDGYMPTMQKGDILGHEFMGRVVERGKNVRNLNIDDRVVVPFPIACGKCSFCLSGQSSLCDNSNPNAWLANKAYGHSGSGIFGYSHLLGGYAGGQAQFVRVPYGDFGPCKIPEGVSDDKALFLSDIFPTGYMAAENGDIEAGDIVAVWGAGPVGQFTARSAFMLGAERVIVIDRIKTRLDQAAWAGAETLNFEEVSINDALAEMTGGRGPDVCIDAVGLEAHGHGLLGTYDKVKQATGLVTDRIQALREAIYTCRKGGRVSIPGVYGAIADKFPIGAAFGKALKFTGGQTHVHRYMKPLLKRIENEEIDPAFVISHRVSLSQAPEAYAMFRDKTCDCTKVVLNPAA